MKYLMSSVKMLNSNNQLIDMKRNHDKIKKFYSTGGIIDV